MSLQSSVGIAKIGTNSLRATIPEGIVAYLDILVGDKIDWRMEIKDGKKIVVVTKSEIINKKVAKTGYKYSKQPRGKKQ